MDTDSLQNNIGWPGIHNSCPVNYSGPPPITQHLVSIPPLDCHVDFIHNIYCVDIVHCNPVNLQSSLLWTYISSATRLLYSCTHGFWQTFTCSPLANLLIKAHRQFYTWLLHVDWVAKVRVCKQAQHVAALLRRSMFLKHNFLVHIDSLSSIGHRASRRYLRRISFQPCQLQYAYSLYYKFQVYDGLLP